MLFYRSYVTCYFIIFQTLLRTVACQVEYLQWTWICVGMDPQTSSQTFLPWPHQHPRMEVTTAMVPVSCRAWLLQRSPHRICTPQPHRWAPLPCVWVPQGRAPPLACPSPPFTLSTSALSVEIEHRASIMACTGRRICFFVNSLFSAVGWVIASPIQLSVKQVFITHLDQVSVPVLSRTKWGTAMAACYSFSYDLEPVGTLGHWVSGKSGIPVVFTIMGTEQSPHKLKRVAFLFFFI